MKVTIITGLSGAGKTNAADWYEDKGYYVVDNMPPALIKNFIELVEMNSKKIEKAAFVVDVRGGSFFADLKECISDLKDNPKVDLQILFLEASDAVLIRRYNETRRHHPLTDAATTRAVIEDERNQLAELRNNADYIIDTSNFKIADFKNEMDRVVEGNEKQKKFTINVMSFGYKHGVPMESDLVVDCRFIPNPFYVPSLKKLTGNNKKVQQYVLKFDITKEFIIRYKELLLKMIPGYIKEGKFSLNLGFACTGGQHRSVTMANVFAGIFKEEGYRVTLNHRDLKH